MNRLKIGYFVGSMNCGGAETMLMNIFEKLDKSKYDVTFIVNISKPGWYDSRIKELGGKILNIKRMDKLNIKKYIEYLKNIFIKEKFDIIHSHTFLHTGFVMKAAKEANIKIRIAHSHSNMDVKNTGIKYKLKKVFLRKMILKNATNLVACSHESGICLFGKTFDNVGIVINNPIKVEEIRKNIDNNARAKELKKIYDISPSKLVIGHVGRFVDVKNHEFLIQIADKLKKSNVDFKLFLIGDGELKEKIEKKVIELGLKDDIIFTGNILNVYEFINLFDIFLLPSLYEGLPLSALEAQGFGKMCILSDRITREIDIIQEKVIHLAIDDANLWADEIILNLNKIDNKENPDTIDMLVSKGYDTNSIIRKLEYIYGG
ncbi:MAG: glycosyltransferase [Clostridia bacterium]